MFFNFYLATTIPSFMVTEIFNRRLLAKVKNDGFKLKRKEYSVSGIVIGILGLMLELVPFLNMLIAYKAVKSVINKEEYLNKLTALFKANLICMPKEEKDSTLSHDINESKLIDSSKDIETKKEDRSIQNLTQEERIQLGQALIEKQRQAREELDARAKARESSFTYLKDVTPDMIIEDTDLDDGQHFGRR